MKSFLKRSVIAILLIICMGTIAGCTMGTVLSTTDNEEIAQYVASVLYKRSYAFQNKYPDYGMVVPEETTAEEETAVIDVTDPEETTTASEEHSSEAESTAPSKNFDVATSLGIDPITITYVSHEFNPEYAIGDFYITPSDSDNTFLIVHFELKNPTYLAETINTRDLHPVFRMEFPDGTHTTNSDNPYDFTKDLSNLMDVEIAATSSVEGVLLFELTPEQAVKLDNFTISYDDKSIEIR